MEGVFSRRTFCGAHSGGRRARRGLVYQRDQRPALGYPSGWRERAADQPQALPLFRPAQGQRRGDERPSWPMTIGNKPRSTGPRTPASSRPAGPTWPSLSLSSPGRTRISSSCPLPQVGARQLRLSALDGAGGGHPPSGKFSGIEATTSGYTRSPRPRSDPGLRPLCSPPCSTPPASADTGRDGPLHGERDPPDGAGR